MQDENKSNDKWNDLAVASMLVGLKTVSDEKLKKGFEARAEAIKARHAQDETGSDIEITKAVTKLMKDINKIAKAELKKTKVELKLRAKNIKDLKR